MLLKLKSAPRDMTGLNIFLWVTIEESNRVTSIWDNGNMACVLVGEKDPTSE